MGSSKILIQNLGKGGLAFLSHINLPQNEDISLKFTFSLGEQTVTLVGFIARKKEETGVYRYVVKFQLQKTEQENLNRMLSSVKDEWKPNTDIIFYNGSVRDFFNEQEEV